MTPIRRATRRAGERLQTKIKSGVLGREDGVLRDGAGKYYVREIWADGRLMPSVRLPLARGAQVPIQLNVAVKLGYDNTGQRVILSADEKALVVQGIDPSKTNALDPQNQLLKKEQVQELRCRPSTNTNLPLSAEVLPAKFVLNGTYYEWSGGSIDLSGEVPSAGNHCYTVVFWRSSTNNLSIASSTPQATSAALDDTDVQEAIDAADADAEPVKAFELIGGQTALIIDRPE